LFDSTLQRKSPLLASPRKVPNSTSPSLAIKGRAHEVLLEEGSLGSGLSSLHCSGAPRFGGGGANCAPWFGVGGGGADFQSPEICVSIASPQAVF
jgi:hypothetical protein